MKKNILITGGAGFIGSHLADELLNSDYSVTILDNLSPQVHGDISIPPSYLDSHIQFIYGDIRNPEHIEKALKGIDAVFHFASAVGVGQSMYEIRNYTDVNNIGTAVLLEQLIKTPVEKLVIASSMSVYGEGLYQKEDGSLYPGVERTIHQLKKGKWELSDEEGRPLKPVKTPETKNPSLSSIYALSKYDQERMCLITGKAYGFPVTALRFFNVYGTRQALSNPYTGVLAIFASRYLNNNPPLIYEDGNQMRDFVSVYDIARGCRLALEVSESDGKVFNIGSGKPYTILQIANELAQVLNKEEISPVIKGKYRIGDIRHCYADISSAETVLGYSPKVNLREGLLELSEWLVNQSANDQIDMANAELDKRGLTI